MSYHRRGIRLWLLPLLMAALLLTPAPPAASDDPTWEAEQERLIEEELQAVDTEPLEAFLDELDRELADYLTPMTVRDVVDWIRGAEDPLSPLQVMGGLLRYLFAEVLAQTGLLGQLIILAVLAAILHNLRAAFEDNLVGQVAYAAVFLVLATIALGSFRLAFALAHNLMEDLVSFMVAMLPLLAVLLTGVGAVTTAGIFHPLLIMVINAIGIVAKDVVLPLLFIGVILHIVSDFVEAFSLSKLAALSHDIAVALLGLLLTVFMGIVTVQGAVAGLADSVALRSAKFLTGTFVPVVGAWMSDALELVVGSSLIVKNAVGLFGMSALFLLLVFPLLKLVALVFIYRLAAAVIQPVGGHQVVSLLQHIAHGLTLVAAASTVVAVMFLISVTILLAAGNLTVMMR